MYKNINRYVIVSYCYDTLSMRFKDIDALFKAVIGRNLFIGSFKSVAEVSDPDFLTKEELLNISMNEFSRESLSKVWSVCLFINQYNFHYHARNFSFEKMHSCFNGDNPDDLPEQLLDF